MDLYGKTAIVTGSGRGIGKAIAIELAKEGCNLVITSRNAGELQEVVDATEKNGVRVLCMPLDLSNDENLDLMMKKTLKEFNSIDILINNAGAFLKKPFLETTANDLDRLLAINLRTAYILSQKALMTMKEKRSGYIINICTTAAPNVPADMSAYGISKCGIIGLSNALYETAKDFDIKISTVYPDVTSTEMIRDIFPSDGRNEWITPEDIAGCVIFLLKQSDRIIIREMITRSVGFDRSGR